MASYKVIFALIGPIVLPLVSAGVRYLLNRKNKTGKQSEEFDVTSKRGLVDDMIDVGLSSLTRGKRRRM